jgi:hypothetical protein
MLPGLSPIRSGRGLSHSASELRRSTTPIGYRADRLQSRPGGRIDVFGVHPSGVSVAVEIDRASNQWSIEKLNRQAEQGIVALWVKWGGPSRIVVPNTIGLIELRARYRRTSDGTRIIRHAFWTHAGA